MPPTGPFMPPSRPWKRPSGPLPPGSGARASERLLPASAPWKGVSGLVKPTRKVVGRGTRVEWRSTRCGSPHRRSEPAPSGSDKTVDNHPMARRDRAKPCGSAKVFAHYPCVGTRKDGSDLRGLNHALVCQFMTREGAAPRHAAHATRKYPHLGSERDVVDVIASAFEQDPTRIQYRGLSIQAADIWYMADDVEGCGQFLDEQFR